MVFIVSCCKIELLGSWESWIQRKGYSTIFHHHIGLTSSTLLLTRIEQYSDINPLNWFLSSPASDSVLQLSEMFHGGVCRVILLNYFKNPVSKYFKFVQKIMVRQETPTCDLHNENSMHMNLSKKNCSAAPCQIYKKIWWLTRYYRPYFYLEKKKTGDLSLQLVNKLQNFQNCHGVSLWEL